MTHSGATMALDQRGTGDRERNIARTLRILRGICGATITPGQIGSRESWSPRSVMSYLRVLNEAGYAEPVQRHAGRETRWRITDAGKAHLQSVTAGSIGTNLDLHPATLGRDQ